MKIAFDPDNLFPQLDSSTGEPAHSYQEAQVHSAEVDRFLGLRIEEVEAKLSQDAALTSTYSAAGVRSWIGLPSKTLLTPYTEIRELLDRLHLHAGEIVIDLGAAYGRMGFVMGRHFPDVWFYGYELVRERVVEGQRVLHSQGFTRVTLETQDLTALDFQMHEADVYFLYDFGSDQAIEKTLRNLREVAMQRAIRVVGRGRASRDAIERNHPWLSQVKQPQHFAQYSIYSSR